MALLVWFTMGIALWHFTVFLPDRFWQGIVGAFLGSVLGAVVFGAVVEAFSGKGLGDTDVRDRVPTAIPGVRDRAGGCRGLSRLVRRPRQNARQEPRWSVLGPHPRRLLIGGDGPFAERSCKLRKPARGPSWSA